METALRFYKHADCTASASLVPRFVPAALPFESSGLNVMLRKHFQMI